ncbi:helix-hairpin-helix domain-containing protein [Hahella sp. SMD15-11]|uniref:Helix-hairpin-helix domain-containing protein n=1 Tax=Thermohahella caldifontis TaxID=3142973 RepID=A0AB39UUY1_9GAMM
MGFIGFLMGIAIIWLLWNIMRNTSDALDKQTALQYEVVALEKRVDELLEALRNQAEARAEVRPMRLNVNTASMTALTGLPGIGRVLAKRIVDGRPWASVDDLARVEGMNPELLDSLRDRLEV